MYFVKETADLTDETLLHVWNCALGYCRKVCSDEYLENWRNLPRPSEVSNRHFLSELAWCAYNAGMSERIIAKKWPALEKAFREFDAEEIIRNREGALTDAVKIINHPGKAKSKMTSPPRRRTIFTTPLTLCRGDFIISLGCILGFPPFF